MPKFLYYRPSPFEKADTIPLLSSSKTAPLPLNLILTSANSGFFLKAFNTLNFLPHLSVRHRLGGDITPTRHGLGPSAHSKAGDTPKQTACKGRVSKLYVLGRVMQRTAHRGDAVSPGLAECAGQGLPAERRASLPEALDNGSRSTRTGQAAAAEGSGAAFLGCTAGQATGAWAWASQAISQR